MNKILDRCAYISIDVSENRSSSIVSGGGGGADRQVVPLDRPLLEDGVALEEVDRLEVEAGGHGGHDGEVLLARDVVEPQRVPQHQVPIIDRTVPARPRNQATGHSDDTILQLKDQHLKCTYIHTSQTK